MKARSNALRSFSSSVASLLGPLPSRRPTNPVSRSGRAVANAESISPSSARWTPQMVPRSCLMFTVEQMYNAVARRDASLAGAFFLGVTTTGIFCRPGCPARVPNEDHCEFFATATAAMQAGYRACKRCSPRSPTPSTRPAARSSTSPNFARTIFGSPPLATTPLRPSHLGLVRSRSWIRSNSRRSPSSNAPSLFRSAYRLLMSPSKSCLGSEAASRNSRTNAARSRSSSTPS
jgi:Metal binding domain of Ada